MKESIGEKKSNLNNSISSKFPRVHSKTSSAFNYIKDVWEETFPNEDEKVKKKL
jgi:hypothetical protein